MKTLRRREFLASTAAAAGALAGARLGWASQGEDIDALFDRSVVVDALSEDHVGLASDYTIRGIEATATRENWYVPRLTMFRPAYRVRWPPWVKELDPPERFRNVARGLATRGYRPGDIEKILGGNWARYFGGVLGA